MLKRIAEQRPIRADKPFGTKIMCPMYAICRKLCEEILQRDTAGIQPMPVSQLSALAQLERGNAASFRPIVPFVQGVGCPDKLIEQTRLRVGCLAHRHASRLGIL